MQVPSSTKTEQRAVNALEAIIDEHSTMVHQFNGNDKEMSWDGYIWLYKKNDGAQSKSNFDGRVSVQIKGHNDPQHKFLNSEKISYPVELDDLKAYATEKGVLYFLIFWMVIKEKYSTLRCIRPKSPIILRLLRRKVIQAHIIFRF